LIYVARTIASVAVLARYPLGIGGFNALQVDAPALPQTVLSYPLPTFESWIPFVTVSIHFGIAAGAVLAGAILATLWALKRRMSINTQWQLVVLGFVVALVPGFFLGTFAPAISWLGQLTYSGAVAPGFTLFNGLAMWSFISLGLAVSLMQLTNQSSAKLRVDNQKALDFSPKQRRQEIGAQR
jgi:hypothetical protein